MYQLFHFFKKKDLPLLILALVLPTITTQAQGVLAGRVTDTEGNRLIGANAWIKELKMGAATDEEGNFSITNVPTGDYTLRVTYIGYKALEKAVSVTGNVEKNFYIFELEGRPVQFDELIVKSTRAGSKSPFTYTNIDKEDLEKNNLGQDVPYLLRWTPSAVVTSDAGTGIGYTGIRIRGSDPSRINVTINGIPLNDAESQNTFWVDLPDFASSTEDIQIQRGVGTSTNGSSAFGATINLNTTSVHEEAYAEFNASAGSFNTRKGNIRFGSGFLDGKFTIDGRISTIGSDGFIDRGSADLWSWYGSAAYIGRRTTARLNVFSGHERTYQAWCGVPAQLIETDRTNNPCGIKSDGTYYDDQVDDYRQTHYQALFNHQMTERLNLNLALHYTRGEGYYEEWRNGDALSDYGIPEVIMGQDTFAEADLARRRWLDNHFYGSVFSMTYTGDEIRLESTIGGGWHQYDGIHFGEVISTEFDEIETPQPPYYENDALKTDFNIYWKTQYPFLETVRAFVDLQYRRVDYSFLGFDEGGNNVTQEVNLNFFNPKAGLFYDISSHASAYASFAVGHREPNRDDYTESSVNSRPQSERLYDTEVGFRRMWNRASLEVVGYYMYYKDQLALTGEVNDVGAYTRVNVPESYRAGLEITGGANIWRELHFSASGTFSRNKISTFTEYIDNWDTGGQVIVEHENTDLSFSPEIIASGELSYEFFAGKPRYNLVLGLASKYVGSQYIDNTSNENTALDPYFFSDFRIGYTWRPSFVSEIELTFLIQNIWDAKFSSNAWTYRFLSADYDPRPDDPYAQLEGGNIYNLTGFYPQAGRNFLVGIKLRI